MKNKHTNACFASILLCFASLCQAQEVSTEIKTQNEAITSNLAQLEQNHFKFLNIKNTEGVGLSDFGYNEINQYITKKEQRKKIKDLAEHISLTYNLDLSHATDIVSTSFSESQKQNVEPLLTLAIIKTESEFKQRAVSPMGAIGLTQVMPQYHRSKLQQLRRDKLDIWSIQGNIRVGVQVLKEYIQAANGNVQQALQAYNGSTSDSKHAYSKKVFATMQKLSSVIL